MGRSGDKHRHESPPHGAGTGSPPRAEGKGVAPADPLLPAAPPSPDDGELPTNLWRERLRHAVFGRPRDLTDAKLFEHISLIALLAWVGLGADGLSSSSYGPEEAFRTLGEHTYLAVAIAGMMAFTVFVIAAAYSRIIEEFPTGGGGYLVASKLLGPSVGVVSGSALLVDYVLTIAVSIASSCDALFSMLPLQMQSFKVETALVLIVGLTILNIRGVKESVIVLTPIFVVFLLAHVLLIVGAFVSHSAEIHAVMHSAREGYASGMSTLGLGGMLLLLAHAYSLGGGTYTGIEAVSNGMPIMREPRVRTGRRTMLYMAVSLAFTASGLLLCYLLYGVTPEAGKTLNATLAERFSSGMPGGAAFVVLTLISEGALLVVAAQAGFLDGPRVLANMAVDSWVPHRFATLSERLTTRNGIVLMGAAAAAALLYTRGDVRRLVVMYSINVFLTFSLSMLGMLRLSVSRRRQGSWKGRTALFSGGLALCVTILAITTIEKFGEGGWITVAVTGVCVLIAALVRRHYRTVAAKLQALDDTLAEIEGTGHPIPKPFDRSKPTAAILVANYSGLGVHTILSVIRHFPGHFKNMVFLSVGVVDSGTFKGTEELAQLRQSIRKNLDRYVALAHRLGFAAEGHMRMGTDRLDEAEEMCREVLKEMPRTVFFAGRLVFRKEQWFQGILHNQMALSLQRRLQWQGLSMIILPVRVQ
jgi:amino acid transporter